MHAFKKAILLHMQTQVNSNNLRSILLTTDIAITYVHSTVFLTFLVTKTSCDSFGVKIFSKIFFYIGILTWSLSLSLACFSLFFTLNSIYALQITSTGFILVALWYVFLYSLTISSTLSINTFLKIGVIYL